MGPRRHGGIRTLLVELLQDNGVLHRLHAQLQQDLRRLGSLCFGRLRGPYHPGQDQGRRHGLGYLRRPQPPVSLRPHQLVLGDGRRSGQHHPKPHLRLEQGSRVHRTGGLEGHGLRRPPRLVSRLPPVQEQGHARGLRLLRLRCQRHREQLGEAARVVELPEVSRLLL